MKRLYALAILIMLTFPLQAADLPRQAETPGLLARMLGGPMAGVEKIVLCERAQDRDGHWYANFGYQCHNPERYVYGPGGGRLLILNIRTGEKTILLDDPEGGVRDPVVDYEAKNILFSYRPGGTHQYHLYEMNLETREMTQITSGDWNDYEPCYLPDGGIMFISSRCFRWVPCWYTPVGIMYRCERDGSNVRQVSFGVEHENHPWVLPDGRVLYTRWEYVDRHTNGFHHLWTVNPDGSGEMVYYGNTQFGRLFIDAKPIPDSEKIAMIAGPGHGKSEHEGDILVVDPNLGTNNTKPKPDENGDANATQLNERQEIQINRHTRASENPKSMMAWRDVLPFSEDCFLVCCKDGLYVMDGRGNFECIYRAPSELITYQDGQGREQTQPLFVNEPRLLAPRDPEPDIPPRVNYSKTTAQLILSDIYFGRRMEGVKKGEIKSLLIMEELPKPISLNWAPGPYRTRHPGESGSIIIHRVLGTVPVEPDGSANFEVPAQRALFFVGLDENGIAVKRMQSFVSLMPGEKMSCVGCHENRNQAPDKLQYASLEATKRKPSQIQKIDVIPDSGLIDFPRDVQPVLDRNCVKCHNAKKTAGKVRLDGARTPRWTFGYSSLIEHGQTGMAGKYFNQAQFGNMPPRSFGSPVSKLLDKARGGKHHGVDMNEKDFQLLATWVDSSACFAGTYASLAMPEPRYPTSNAPRTADTPVAEHCGACHLPEKARRNTWPFGKDTWVDLENPSQSYILQAPLSKEAGGLGLCRQAKAKSSGEATPNTAETKPAAVFYSRDDDGYKAVEQYISDVVNGRIGTGNWQASVDVTQPAYWQKGFVPSQYYTRELKRYGVLDKKWQPGDDTDWFEIEERYYDIFYAKPDTEAIGGE